MFGQKRLVIERGEIPMPWHWPEIAGLSSILIGSANVIAFLAVQQWTAVWAGGVCVAATLIALSAAGRSHHDRWLIRAALWIGLIAGAVMVPAALLEILF
jgi:hypothetical protein